MNQKRQHPNDAMFEPESPETTAKLDLFEQRLKATRPAAVQLNAASLQELAQGRAVDAMVDLPPSRTASSAVMIVGSWVCGVTVGAVVMFLLMSTLAPGKTTIDKDDVVQSEQEQPKTTTGDSVNDVLPNANPNLPDESTIVTLDRTRKTNEAKLTMAFDPFVRTDSEYLNDGPTLQAGTHLRRASAAMSWPFAMITDTPETKKVNTELHPFESQSKPIRSPENGPPTSRRELMREFLGDRSEAVL